MARALPNLRPTVKRDKTRSKRTAIYFPLPIRGLLFILIASVLIYLFLIRPTSSSQAASLLHFSPDGSKRPGHATLENLSLTETQCRASFPGLLNEVDAAVAAGPFDVGPNDGRSISILQVRIENGKIWILEAPGKGDLSQGMREVRNHHESLST
jgi:hypothetical protein